MVDIVISIIVFNVSIKSCLLLSAPKFSIKKIRMRKPNLNFHRHATLLFPFFLSPQIVCRVYKTTTSQCVFFSQFLFINRLVYRQSLWIFYLRYFFGFSSYNNKIMKSTWSYIFLSHRFYILHHFFVIFVDNEWIID